MTDQTKMPYNLKYIIELNDEVKKQIPDVEHVFLFDDENDLILHSILKNPNGQNLQYSVTANGRHAIRGTTTAKVSVYTMPDGKRCAVCYPDSVKVNYDHFEDGIRKIFKHVDDRDWSKNSYAFYLFCVKHGFNGILDKVIYDKKLTTA